MPDNNKKLNYQQQASVDVVSGLVSGVSCAWLLNPWDRAIYLSIKHSRSFLSLENFKNPYHGALQAVSQRAILGSLYFTMQGEMKTYLYPYLRETLHCNEMISQMGVGIVSGGVYGAVINPMSAVKYHTWGNDKRVFLTSLKEMYTKGGLKTFSNGMVATIMRDTLFGCVYEVSRNVLYNHIVAADKVTSENKKTPIALACDMFAGGGAAMAAGPFNYVRNVQYSIAPDKKPPSSFEILKNVWADSKNHSGLARAGFFQQKFRIGWGTARVSAGMGLAQWMFDQSRNFFQDKIVEHEGRSLKKS